MTNAFDTRGPSTVLKGVRHKNTSQMRKDAECKNREANLCTFIQPEKAQKMRKASI